MESDEGDGKDVVQDGQGSCDVAISRTTPMKVEANAGRLYATLLFERNLCDVVAFAATPRNQPPCPHPSFSYPRARAFPSIRFPHSQARAGYKSAAHTHGGHSLATRVPPAPSVDPCSQLPLCEGSILARRLSSRSPSQLTIYSLSLPHSSAQSGPRTKHYRNTLRSVDCLA